MIHLTGPPWVVQTTRAPSRRYRAARRGCPSSAVSRPLLPVSPLNGGAPGIAGKVTITGVARIPLSLAAGGVSGVRGADSATGSERAGAGAEGMMRESSALPGVGAEGRAMDGASFRGRTSWSRGSLGCSMAGTRGASVLGAEILGGGSGLETSRAGAAFAVRGSVRGLATSSVGAVGADAIGVGALGVGAIGCGATAVGAGGFAAGSGCVTETLWSTARLRRAE